MFSNIVIDIFDSMCLIMQRLCAISLVATLHFFGLGGDSSGRTFKPTMEYFEANVLGADNMRVVMEYLSRIGLAVMLILFGFGMIGVFLHGIKESKDDLRSLFVRLFLCFFIVYYGPTAMNAIMTDMGKLYDEAAQRMGTGIWIDNGDLTTNLAVEREGWLSGLQNVADGDEDDQRIIQDTVYKSITQAGEFVEELLWPLVMIVRIIFYIMIMYNFLKLAVELIKRYLMMCVLYMGFPIVAGTFVTAESARIFSAYCKMFFTEIIVIILTNLWIKLTVFLMNVVTADLVGTFIILAFINIGNRMEQWLKDMGCTTANTGGALLDSVLFTGAALGMAFRGGKRLAGGQLSNLGGFTGNTALSRLGSGLKNGDFSTLGGLKDAAASTGAAARRAMSGGTEAFTSQKGRDMYNAWKNGSVQGKGALASAYGALNSAGQKEFLHQAQTQMFGNKGANSLNSMLGVGKGSASASITGIDSKGNFVGQLDNALGTQNFTLSSSALNGNSMQIQDANGNAAYLTMDSAVDFKEGSGLTAENLGIDSSVAIGDNALAGSALDTMYSEYTPQLERAAMEYGLDSFEDATFNQDADGLTMTAGNGDIIANIPTKGDAIFAPSPSVIGEGNENETNISNFQRELEAGIFKTAGYSNISKVEQLDSRNARAGYAFEYINSEGERRRAKCIPAVSATDEEKRGRKVYDNRYIFINQKPKNSGNDDRKSRKR